MPNPHAYKNTHAVKHMHGVVGAAGSPERLRAIQQKTNNTIVEQDDESDASTLNIVTEKEKISKADVV